MLLSFALQYLLDSPLVLGGACVEVLIAGVHAGHVSIAGDTGGI